MSHIYSIQAPDGNTYSVVGPDGATRDQVIAEVLKQNPSAGKYKQQTTDQAAKSGAEKTAAETGSVTRGLAGAGKAFVDIGRGTSQTLQDIGSIPALMDKDNPQKRAQAVSEAEQRRQKTASVQAQDKPLMDTPAGRVGNIAGNVAAFAPATLVPGAQSVPGAMALGALMGAAQPVGPKDSRAENIIGGAATGVLGKLTPEGTGKAVGAMIAPKVSAAKKDLMDAGVRMTPGQIAGGVTRRTEEAAKSAPLLGSAIREGETRAIKDYNIATINKSLEPLGVKLPDNIQAGHGAISAGQQILDHAYDSVLPNITFGMDRQFSTELQAIRDTAKELPKDQAKQFENVLNQRFAKRVAPVGAMDGGAFKQVQSEFSRLARNYKSSGDPAQRDLGATFEAVGNAMRDAVERQNPQFAPQLAAANKAYAMFARVEDASSRRAGSEGVFTPSDLLQSVKKQDKSVRKKAFAAGDSLMQDWAESGSKVLGNKLPDSGTTERALTLAGIAALAHRPDIAIGAAAATAPYTRPGQALVNSIARNYASASPMRQAIAQKTQQTLSAQPNQRILQILFPELFLQTQK